MKWFRELFSESSDVSMGRFLSFLCVVAAILVALKAVVSGSDLNAASVLCGTFLAGGLGSKVVQKFAEKESSSD